MENEILLEEGLENFEKSIRICNDFITAVQVTIEKTGYFGCHYHRNSFEVYELKKGLATLWTLGNDNHSIGRIELNSIIDPKEIANEYAVKNEVKHCLYAKAGSVITIYRFKTNGSEPVGLDINKTADFLIQSL